MAHVNDWSTVIVNFFQLWRSPSSSIIRLCSGLLVERTKFDPCSRRNLLNRKWSSIAHSLSLSTSHRPDMTEILLKGGKIASYPFIHPTVDLEKVDHSRLQSRLSQILVCFHEFILGNSWPQSNNS